MFDAYHYTIKLRSNGRKTMMREKGKFGSSLFLFSFLSVFSLSLYFSSDRTGKATVREK
jgi:hypothetical protein